MLKFRKNRNSFQFDKVLRFFPNLLWLLSNIFFFNFVTWHFAKFGMWPAKKKCHCIRLVRKFECSANRKWESKNSKFVWRHVKRQMNTGLSLRWFVIVFKIKSCRGYFFETGIHELEFKEIIKVRVCAQKHELTKANQ